EQAGETATANDTDDGCDQTHESGLDDDEGKDRPSLGTQRNEDRQVARALHDRRRAGVVNDEHPGQQPEAAQAVDHRSKGSPSPTCRRAAYPTLRKSEVGSFSISISSPSRSTTRTS